MAYRPPLFQNYRVPCRPAVGSRPAREDGQAWSVSLCLLPRLFCPSFMIFAPSFSGVGHCIISSVLPAYLSASSSLLPTPDGAPTSLGLVAPWEAEKPCPKPPLPVFGQPLVAGSTIRAPMLVVRKHPASALASWPGLQCMVTRITRSVPVPPQKLRVILSEHQYPMGRVSISRPRSSRLRWYDGINR